MGNEKCEHFYSLHLNPVQKNYFSALNLHTLYTVQDKPAKHMCG